MMKRFFIRIADIFAGALAVFNFDNRSVIRGVYIPRALLITNAIMAIAVICLMYNYSYDYRNYHDSIRFNFFIGLAFVQFAILILLPARTATVIITEKEKENIDHFFLTRLSSFQLVIGKLFSSIGIYLLFFISTIPVLAIMICYTGGVSLEEFLVTVLLIIANIFKLSAICIYLSVRIKKAGAAIVFSYISILMLFFILPSFFTEKTVFNDIFYGGFPDIFSDFIGVGLSLIPLLIFFGFVVAEFYFVLRRKVESWKSYLLVSVAGVILLLIFILDSVIKSRHTGYVPYLNPIEFLMIFWIKDMDLIYSGYPILSKIELYFEIFQYIAAAAISSFVLLYLAARRLDVLRWGKV